MSSPRTDVKPGVRSCRGAHLWLYTPTCHNRQAATYACGTRCRIGNAPVPDDGGPWGTPHAWHGDGDLVRATRAALSLELRRAGVVIVAALARCLRASPGAVERRWDEREGEVGVRDEGYRRRRPNKLGRSGAGAYGIHRTARRVVICIETASLAVLTAYAVEGGALVGTAVEVCETFLPPDYFRLGGLDREEGMLVARDL